MTVIGDIDTVEERAKVQGSCVLDEDADPFAERPGLLVLADKGYVPA
jgi:hypothetical protein